MAAAFDRAGFDARRRAHERPARRAASTCADFSGARRLRRLLLRRRARRRRGLGQVDPVQRARARRVRRVLRAPRHVRARRVQRLPDDVATCKELIPGAEHWPRFVRNRSEQFEARLALVRDREAARRCSSRAWTGRALPIAVAHGEGRAEFARRRRPRRARAVGPGRGALRRPPRAADRALPGQPQRLAGRHHRAHHAATAASRS